MDRGIFGAGCHCILQALGGLGIALSVSEQAEADHGVCRFRIALQGIQERLFGDGTIGLRAVDRTEHDPIGCLLRIAAERTFEAARSLGPMAGGEENAAQAAP